MMMTMTTVMTTMTTTMTMTMVMKKKQRRAGSVFCGVSSGEETNW